MAAHVFSLLILKIIAALALFATSLITGLGPIRVWLNKPHHPSLALSEALAGGIFLGAAFFHMLPQATSEFAAILGSQKLPLANLLCGFGFASLLLLEKVIIHHAKQRYRNSIQVIPYILILVLSLHALTEGAALGVNTTTSNAVIIFIAIIVHKTSESFAIASNLTKKNISLSRSFLLIMIFSLMTPIGIFLGSFSSYGISPHNSTLLEAVINSFAAGTFLYIATLHNLLHRDIHEETNYLHELIIMFAGLAVMAILAIWV